MPSITVDELQRIVGGQTTPPQAQKSAAAPMSAPPVAPTGAKLRPELVQTGQRFPALQPYLSNVVVQPGKNKKSDDRQVEFYPPWESQNPNPGKLTVETYHPDLTSGEGLTNTVSGELLHYIGGVNPATGKPVDPNYYSLKQKVSAARTPQQQKLDRQIYEQQRKQGEKRSFNDWLNQSRLDEYVMGYVTPDKTDEWRKRGFYNSPSMKSAVEGVKNYLTSQQKTAAPSQIPLSDLQAIMSGQKQGQQKQALEGAQKPPLPELLFGKRAAVTQPGENDTGVIQAHDTGMIGRMWEDLMTLPTGTGKTVREAGESFFNPLGRTDFQQEEAERNLDIAHKKAMEGRSGVAKAVSAAGEGVGSFISGQVSPFNMALLFEGPVRGAIAAAEGAITEAGPVAGTLGKLAHFGFTVQMATGAVDASQASVDAFRRGDYESGIKLAVDGLISGVMARGGVQDSIAQERVVSELKKHSQEKYQKDWYKLSPQEKANVVYSTAKASPVGVDLERAEREGLPKRPEIFDDEGKFKPEAPLSEELSQRLDRAQADRDERLRANEALVGNRQWAAAGNQVTVPDEEMLAHAQKRLGELRDKAEGTKPAEKPAATSTSPASKLDDPEYKALFDRMYANAAAQHPEWGIVEIQREAFRWADMLRNAPGPAAATEKPVGDGKPSQVEAKQVLNPKEHAEYKFLQQHAENLAELREAYNVAEPTPAGALSSPQLRVAGSGVIEFRRNKATAFREKVAGEMAAIPAPGKRQSEESPNLVTVTPMTPEERAEQQWKELRERSLRTLEDERAREAQQQNDIAEQNEEQDYSRGKIQVTDRRRHAELANELLSGFRRREEKSAEERNYEEFTDRLQSAGEALYPSSPGIPPEVVYERLRRQRSDGHRLNPQEEGFMSTYARRKAVERGLLERQQRGAAADIVSRVDREQVLNILDLARREDDLYKAAVSLRKQAQDAPDLETLDLLNRQAIEAREAAEKLRTQRESEQAERRAVVEGSPVTEFGAHIPALLGNPTRIDLPDGKSLPAHYGGVRLSKLKISHDPFTFEWNPEYKPQRMQPRNLQTNERAQFEAKESDKPGVYKADRYTANVPTAEHGPAIILKDGRVAGGNSRLIRLIRALQNGGNKEAILREMYSALRDFGIETDEAIDMDDPLIPVRILDDTPEATEELVRMGQDLNRDHIMGFSSNEQAVMAGARLQQGDIDRITSWMEQLPDNPTLRKLLTTRGQEIFDMMVSRDIIPANKLELYTTNGKLAEDTKLLFERMIRGKVFDDTDVLLTTPEAIMNKMDRSLPALLRIKTAAPEWNVTDYLQRAMEIWRGIDSVRDELNDLEVPKGVSPSLIDKYFHPQNYKMGTGMLTFEEGQLRPIPHPITDGLARLLDMGPLAIKEAFDKYADEAEQRQTRLMGSSLTPVEAFNEFIGSKVGIDVSPLDWGTLTAAPPEQKAVFDAEQQPIPKPGKAEKAAQTKPDEMDPLPAIQQHAEALRAAAINGTVTEESLRGLFSADPRFSKWAEPLMRIFGKIVPNATGMSLPQFLRKALANFKISTEAEYKPGGESLSQVDTKTPAFQNWFGDSKVLDEAGNPLVVYHGTTKDFDVFDRDRAGDSTGHRTARLGFFFTKNPKIATDFVGYDEGDWNPYYDGKKWKPAPNRGGNVVASYLSVKNPFEMTAREFQQVVLNSSYDSDIVPELIRKISEQGKDGILIHADKALADTMAGSEWGDDTWVAFRPEQIKSAIGNRGTFDPNDPSYLYQQAAADAAPVWYLKSQRILDNKMRGAMSSADVLKLLTNGGVKAEELKWTALEEFLASKERVTPQEVQDYLAENNIQIKEVMKGEAPPTTPSWTEVGGMPAAGETKFDSFTLPGGKNYRELLLTLPAADRYELSELELLNADNDMSNMWFIKAPGQEFQILKSNYPTAEAAMDYIVREKDRSDKPPAFTTNHFNEKNILAHVRFNERTLPDGRKMLMLEEVQSDWHQKGRTQGYTATEEQRQAAFQETKRLRLPASDAIRAIEDLGYDSHVQAMRAVVDNADWATRWDVRPLTDEQIAAVNAWRESHLRREKAFTPGVPDAPFKKTWHEMALRRMLRYAAENGYDAIGWTTGEQQAERYDLSKQIESVYFHPVEPGSNIGYLEAYDHSGKRVIKKPIHNENQIADYIGKDVARKLLETDPDKAMGGAQSLKGQDLKVGGEGMKGFYDKIIPDYLKSYGKKWGARVGSADIPTGQFSLLNYFGPPYTLEELEELRPELRGTVMQGVNDQIISDMKQGSSFEEAMQSNPNRFYAEKLGGDFHKIQKSEHAAIHAMDITTEMRDAVVREGQPLFQGKKGVTDFLEDGRAVIQLFEGADVSTVVHEFFHVMRRYLHDEDLTVLEDYAHKELRKKGIDATAGIWSRDKEEILARAWEKYLATSEAPSPEVKGIFDRLRDAFRQIYYVLANKKYKLPNGSPLRVRVTPEVRAVFDKWFGADERPEHMEPPPKGEMLPPPEDLAPAHAMTLQEYAATPASQVVPKNSALALKPDEITATRLNQFDLKQLQAAAQFWGVAKGGSKGAVIERILDRVALRGKLGHATVEELVKMKGDELKKMVQSAGVYGGGNKESQARALIGFRDGARNRAKFLIAEVRHQLEVERAFNAGKEVPEANLQKYRLGKWQGHDPGAEFRQQAGGPRPEEMQPPPEAAKEISESEQMTAPPRQGMEPVERQRESVENHRGWKFYQEVEGKSYFRDRNNNIFGFTREEMDDLPKRFNIAGVRNKDLELRLSRKIKQGEIGDEQWKEPDTKALDEVRARNNTWSPLKYQAAAGDKTLTIMKVDPDSGQQYQIRDQQGNVYVQGSQLGTVKSAMDDWQKNPKNLPKPLFQQEAPPELEETETPRRNAIGSDALEKSLPKQAQLALNRMFQKWTAGSDLRHIREAMEVYQRLLDMEEKDQASGLSKVVADYFLKPDSDTAMAVDMAVHEGLQKITGEEDPDPAELLENEVFADAQEAGKLIFETLDAKNASFDIQEFNTAFGTVEFRREPEDAFPEPKDRLSLRIKDNQPPKLSPKAAANVVERWKAEAKRQGQTDANKNKIVYSLFDVSGTMSQPWVDAGYTVRRFDIKNGDDMMNFGSWMGQVEDDIAEGYDVYGVIAQPPCTSFTRTGNKWWAKQHDLKSKEWIAEKYGLWATDFFDTPLDYARTLVAVSKLFVAQANPSNFYVLENPLGRIADETGLPSSTFVFDPYHFGDPYTKQTHFWGEFNRNLPTAAVVPVEGSLIHRLSSDVEKNKGERSETPEGLAYAFFMANQEKPYEAPEAEAGATPEVAAHKEQVRDMEPPPRNGVRVAPTAHPVTYLTGSHNENIAKAAKRRGDIGLLVTPLLPQYLQHVKDYPVIAIDNGVFSKSRPFDETKFRDLLNSAAADPEVVKKTRFVVAPDVVGDAKATLEKFGPWADEIHAKKLPVAFAAQDGLEFMPEQIPWDKMDVLFIGGSTEWKIGQHADKFLPGSLEQNPKYVPGAKEAWINLFREAKKRGIPVHMGRVNSAERLNIAEYGLGASTVDGTFIAHGPDINQPKLENWLNKQNSRDDLFEAPPTAPEGKHKTSERHMFEDAMEFIQNTKAKNVDEAYRQYAAEAKRDERTALSKKDFASHFDAANEAEKKTMAPPPSSLETDITPEEREKSTARFHGPKHVTEVEGEPRVKRFDNIDLAKIWALQNKGNFKGMDIYETPEAKAFAVFVPTDAQTLFQEGPQLLELSRRLAVLKLQRNWPEHRARQGEMDAEIARIQQRIDRMVGAPPGATIFSAPPPPRDPGMIIPGAAMSEPPAKPGESLPLFKNEEPTRVPESRPQSKGPDGTAGVRPSGGSEGVAGRAGGPSGFRGDSSSLLGGGAGGTGPRGPGRPAGRESSVIAGTKRIYVAPPTRPRGLPLFEEKKWRSLMEKLRLPQDIPPISVTLNDDIAAVLEYPGQREVVEIILSALQQHDGAIIATGTGTGKTFTSLGVLKHRRENDGSRYQIILAKNKGTIRQDRGWVKGAKDYFQMDVKPMPDVKDMKDLAPGIYVITHAKLLRRPDVFRMKWDDAIIDESQEARRWYKKDSKQGKALQGISENAKKAVYVSATPFQTVLEAGYMSKLGLWAPGEFDSWAAQFGVKKGRNGAWVSVGNDPKKLVKLNEVLIERGQFVTQDENYEGFTANFAMVPLTAEQKQTMRNIETAFNEAHTFYKDSDPTLAKAVRGNAVVFMKMWLERERLPQAIELMKQAKKQGWQVAVFSETNKEFEEIYPFLEKVDIAMDGRLSSLLPTFPSAYDTLKKAFGEDGVANFSGQDSPKRTAELDAFLDAKKQFIYASYAAGGVGLNLHDESGIHPRMAIYLGPSYSGIMLRQALGRLWRYGTRSNVHSVFMASDATPEVRMMLTKIIPRLSSLQAAIKGVDEDDALVRSMRNLSSYHKSAANFEVGKEIKFDISDFKTTQDHIPIDNWASIRIPDAESAKKKGMKYPGGWTKDAPGSISLFQDNGDIRLPERFLSPDEAKAQRENLEIMQRLADGQYVPGAGTDLADLNAGLRKQFADAVGPSVQDIIAQRTVADKSANARLSAQTGMTAILAAKRAGEVDALEEGGGNKIPGWEARMEAPEAKPPNAEENAKITRDFFFTSGKTNIRKVAKQAGRAEIGLRIVRTIETYVADRAHYAGQWMSRYQKIQDENQITKKEHRLLWMTKEGLIPAPNQRIAKAAQQTTELMNDIRQMAADKGIYVEDHDEDGQVIQIPFEDIMEDPHYMPHIHDMREKIRLVDPDTKEEHVFTLGDLLNGGTLSDAKRERILASIEHSTGKSRPEIEDFLQRKKRRTPLSGNMERTRSADLPFYRMDKHAMIQYFESAAEAFSRADHLGQDRSKLGGMVDQIPNVKARQIINTIADGLLKPRPWDEQTGKMYSRLAAAEVMTKMTFSAAKVPFHALHTSLILEQFRPVLYGFLMAGGNYKEMLERATLSGALAEQIRAEAILEHGTDLKLANIALSATGFNWLYKMDRIVANTAAQHWMEKYALPKMMKKAKSAAHIREQLRDKLLIDEANIDRAIQAGRWTKEDLQRGGVALANKAMFTHDPTELPPAWRARADDPVSDNIAAMARMATILKSFTFKTAALLKEQLVDEAKKGNFRPWIPFLLAYPIAGEALRAFSAAVTTPFQWGLQKDEKSAWQKYEDGLKALFDDPTAAKLAQRWLDDVAHATALTMLSHIMDVLLFPNPDKRKARYAREQLKWDVLKEIVGPIYSDAGAALGLVADVVGALTDEEGEKKYWDAAQKFDDWAREESPLLRGVLPKKLKAQSYEMAPPP